jgi:hypothetical protein
MKAGDKVHWTRASQGKRSLSMRRRDGVIVEVDNDREVALVQCGKKQEWVDIVRLRTVSQPSQVTEFVEAMVESAKKPKSARRLIC